jgi:predicted RNA-binding Zn-ribbon protein involved in translation (DUF1610 family)
MGTRIPKTSTAKIFECPKCHSKGIVGIIFYCPDCGTKMQETSITFTEYHCSKCDIVVQPYGDYCYHCGDKLTGQQIKPIKPETVKVGFFQKIKLRLKGGPAR